MPVPPVALPLDVPFLPDPAYAEFLASVAGDLLSLHFSLHLPGGNDGRTVRESRAIALRETGAPSGRRRGAGTRLDT